MQAAPVSPSNDATVSTDRKGNLHIRIAKATVWALLATSFGVVVSTAWGDHMSLKQLVDKAVAMTDSEAKQNALIVKAEEKQQNFEVHVAGLEAEMKATGDNVRMIMRDRYNLIPVMPATQPTTFPRTP